MHDTRFASQIIVCLKEKTGGLPRPKRITANIILSPFSHVSAASLSAAFQMLAEREGLKDVTLNIKKDQASITCKRCKTVTKTSAPIVDCPVCQSADFDIGHAEEFVIESIEIE